MDAVLNWLWQGGVVAMATFVMLLALERARANVRYTVCWIAALLIVALPAFSLLQPTATASGALPGTPGDATLSLPSAWWSSDLVILSAWAVWAGVYGIRFLRAMVTIRRARARSQLFPSQLESVLPGWRRLQSKGRRATLVLSDSVTAAAVLGWGPPVIAVAPTLVNSLDAEDLDRILVHEWTHVQRRDDLVNVVQIFIRTLAGWHPGLWWIDRRLQVEREIACDEVTIAITGAPKSYAQCLLTLAARTSTVRDIQMAPAVLRSSDLRARVVKILSPYPSIAPLWSRCIAGGIVTTLCLMSVGVGGLKLVEPAAAAIALPDVPQTLSRTLEQRAAVMRTPSSQRDTRRSPRRQVASASFPAPPHTEWPSPPDSRSEPDSPAPASAERAVDAVRTAHVDPETTAELPRTVHTDSAPAEVAEERPPSSSAEQPGSPWTAAAAVGTALGDKSKNAGVATAGFFTRFARRVAGSF